MRNLDGLLTVREAASVLGVSKQRLMILLDDYGIETARLGQSIVVERAELSRIPRIRKPGRPPEKNTGTHR